MKHSATIVFAIIFFTSVVSGEVCHDFDFGTPTSTLKELLHLNLGEEGPADGECGRKDKWILIGDVFGLASKCVCIDHERGAGNQLIHISKSNLNTICNYISNRHKTG